VPLSVGEELGPNLAQIPKSPGPKLTSSVPSGILIHPTVWPEYTNVTRQTDTQTTVPWHNGTNGRPKTLKNINKSSAVAEMGDRLVTIGMGRKWGGAAVGGWVPI